MRPARRGWQSGNVGRHGEAVVRRCSVLFLSKDKKNRKNSCTAGAAESFQIHLNNYFRGKDKALFLMGKTFVPNFRFLCRGVRRGLWLQAVGPNFHVFDTHYHERGAV